MSRKLISAQAPFTLLVANLRKSSDPSRGPSGNPVKQRSTFTLQHFVEIPGRGPDLVVADPRTPGIGTRVGHVQYSTAPIPVRAFGQIEVSINVFSGPTQVHLGEYVLVSGIDFLVGALPADTATNLSAAIDSLPGYESSSAGALVDVTGPSGVIGNQIAFYSSGASPQNLVFSPSGRVLEGAEPVLGPPILG